MVYLYIYRLTDGDLRLHTETGLEKLHREFIYIFLVVCVSTVAYNIYYIYIYALNGSQPTCIRLRDEKDAQRPTIN